MVPLAKLTEAPSRASNPARTMVASLGAGPMMLMPVMLTRRAITATWLLIVLPLGCATRLAPSVATVTLPTQLPLMVRVEPRSRWPNVSWSRSLSTVQFTVCAAAGEASASTLATLAQARRIFMRLLPSKVLFLPKKAAKDPAKGEARRQLEVAYKGGFL